MLIVDDERAICEMLRRFFELRGFRTLTAQSGTEALQKLAEEPPEYLLLDLKMPDMSGLEVLKLAKRTYPQLRVVVVTGTNDEAAREQAFQEGACDYITKPLGLDDQAWVRAFFVDEAL